MAPAIALDKDKSKYNGWVKADLQGFTPGDTVTVKWPDGTVLASGAVGSNGKVATGFRTPLDPLGDYKVTVADQHGKKASTMLRVIPRILVGLDSVGPVGDIYRVYFYGFAPGDTVEVKWYNSSQTSYQVVTTLTVADNGRAVSTRLYVPKGSTVGDHWLVGDVVGVARSASTYFTVTPGTAAVDQVASTVSTNAVIQDRRIGPNLGRM